MAGLLAPLPPSRKSLTPKTAPYDAGDWEIRAAAYDFSQQVVRDWFIQNIIKPVMIHGDGVWLDGDGPDNG